MNGGRSRCLAAGDGGGGQRQGTAAGDGSLAAAAPSRGAGELQRGTASSGAGGDVQTVLGLVVRIDLTTLPGGERRLAELLRFINNLALDFYCCLISQSPGELVAQQVIYGEGP